jgi:hypothetical protein
MNKVTFCISAFLVALFINQHVLKSRQITVPVIYATDANGGPVHANDYNTRRQPNQR